MNDRLSKQAAPSSLPEMDREAQFAPSLEAVAREAGTPLARYLTRLIWLAMLPLLLLAGWLAMDGVRAMQAEFDQEAGYIAHNFALSLDRFLVSHIRGLNLLTSGAEEAAGDAQHLRHLYRHALAFREHYGSHVVLAEAGAPGEPMRMLFNTRVPLGSPLPPLPRPAGHAAVPAALATGRPAVGDLFRGPIAGEALLAVTVPIQRDGLPVRVMLATIEAADLQRRLDAYVLPDGWVLTLRDGTGAEIARRGQPMPDAAAGARHAVNFENAPWSAVLEIPHSIYWAPLLSAAAWLGLGVLGAALVGMLGGGWAARRLARAVARLAKPGDGAAGAARPAIAEIAAVHRRLEQANVARTAAEESLRDREERLRRVSDNADVALTRCSRDWIYLSANPACAKLLGRPLEQIVGHAIVEVLGAAAVEKIRPYVERVLRGEQVTYYAEIPYAGVTPRYVHVSYTRDTDATGTIVGWVACVTDITERKSMEEELAASHAQLRALAQRLQDVREAERIRLARDVHDELGQLLTGLSLDVAWLERRVARLGDAEAQQELGNQITEIAGLTDRMLASVQKVASDLRPDALDHLGLCAALRNESERFARRSGIACTMDLPAMPLPLSPDTATALFRIVQECQTNVARHAGATRVDIRLAVCGDSVVIEVRDDGRGITAEQLADPAALGLLGMRERAEQLGGSLRIAGEPGGGTLVTIKVPA